MSIPHWKPSTTYTRQEKALLKRCEKKRKLFGFLRRHRLDIFDEAVERELEAMYRDTGAGKPATPPAMMAIALIMQG